MEPAAEAKLFHVRPDSEHEIVQLAQKTLLRADCIDVLPTPIAVLYQQARVKSLDLPSIDEMPSLRLADGARNLLQTALQKIRGIADLRRRAVYLPQGDSNHRRNFAKGHELGHQLIPWHKVGRDCVDTDTTLSRDVRETFEAEANLFSSEIIFQGKHFRRRALDYKPTFDAVFLLADQHGASRQATIWKFTEEQDFPVACIFYYPKKYSDDLKLWKTVRSPSFREKFCDLDIPQYLPSSHPWVSAREFRELFEGDITLSRSTGRKVTFLWHSWWNEYALAVLIRVRAPLRSLI